MNTGSEWTIRKAVTDSAERDQNKVTHVAGENMWDGEKESGLFICLSVALQSVVVQNQWDLAGRGERHSFQPQVLLDVLCRHES